MTELTHILHLTDLHLGATLDFSHERLIDALCKDLIAQRNEGVVIDFCVFTGDIAYTGDKENFEVALDQIVRILDAAALDEKRMVICPGNHDADRRVVEDRIATLMAFRNTAMSRDGSNQLALTQEFIRYTAATFENFNSLADQFCRDSILHRDLFCTVYFLRSTSIIAINTALLTGTGLSNEVEDRGVLTFPEISLVHALKACPEGVPIIAIGHHPLEYLNDTHSSMLARILSEHCVAYLCGHLHDPLPKAITSPNGNLFVSQGGALYEASEYWNGYALLSADLANRHFKVVFRRWWEPRREFSCAEDLANDGVFFSTPEAEKHWRDLPRRLDKPSLEGWRIATLLPQILKEYNQCLTTHSLEDVFVRPEFERDIVYRKETDERIGSKVEVLSFEQLLNDATNWVISSPKETGKTTILRQLALSIARSAISESKIAIPVLVNFGSFRAYKSHIETLVRQRLPNLPEGINAQSLLQQGVITLLIDDVDFRSIERRDAMLAFFAEFPKCRYIISSSTTFVESAAFQPEISPNVPFVRVKLRGMRPAQLLALIENHGTRDPLKADQLLERVTRDAKALNVPLTAVTSTFLIQIFSDEPDNVPINQAALVERYIEMLLQKFAPRELLPATFNFKNKVDLLSVIAERMTREETFEVEQNAFLGWILEYLKGYGLKYQANDILKYLLESKIIENDDGQVRFRLRVFFEFFIATRMREEPTFREFIFAEERYLRFPNEISFYAAITLRDKDQIDEIYKRYLAISDALHKNTPDGTPLDRYLETLEEPDAEATEDELLEIQRQVRSADQARDDRKALMEGEGTELIDHASQEIIRPTYASDEERWLGHLVLLSGMLKHMELIPDAQKRTILTGLLDGWLRFTAISMGIIGTLAREKKVVFNGVTYLSLMPEDLSVGEHARRLTLMMPIATAKLTSLFLATEKLQLQLEYGLGEKDEPVSRQFLRFAILSDLMVSNLADNANKVSDALKGHRFLTHVLSRKLYEIAIRYRLPDDQLRRVRSLVGDMMTSLSGVERSKAHEKKTNVIKGLERQRLVTTIKKNQKP